MIRTTRIFFGDQANIGRAQALQSHNWVIAGMGGTGISAAEIVFKNNPKATVTLVGDTSPAGLLENDQFRMLAVEHADVELAASMGITERTSRRLSIRSGRVDKPDYADRNKRDGALVDESDIAPSLRSKQVYDVNAKDKGTKVHATGTAYVAALGRNNDYPPIVLGLMADVAKANGHYFVQPLFHDRQYVGYRVRFVINETSATSSASRLPDTSHRANARCHRCSLPVASDPGCNTAR